MSGCLGEWRSRHNLSLSEREEKRYRKERLDEMENVRTFKTTAKILQQATELTDLPIIIASHPTLQMQGVVIHPTAEDPVYRIFYYSELDEEGVNVAVTHELCHVIRALRVLENERLTVRMQPVCQNYKDYHTIYTSLSSYPDDIEIESFIATCIDLKAGQKKLWGPVVDGFKREIEEDFRTLPQRLFQVKHSLDYVLMRRVGELIGEKTTRHYYGYNDVMQEGKELLEIADSVRREDIAGDREVSRLWIERLGIGEVFSLIPQAEAEFADRDLEFLLATNPNVEVSVYGDN